MIAFLTQAQNPDADPAANPAWPWQLEVITSDEQLRQLVSAGWSVMSTAEYDHYCDRVGTVTDPSFAVDKDNVDQAVSGGTTLVTASRVLWDKTGVYDAANSRFIADRDGVLNLNGTITVTGLDGVDVAAIDVYRNDELWFTVAEREVTGLPRCAMSFSCDIDAYKSADHYFDVRIRLAPGTGSGTVSGSDEETAWGLSWVCALYGEPPV